MHELISIEVCCQVAARTNYRGYPHDTTFSLHHFFFSSTSFEMREKKEGGKCVFYIWIFGVKVVSYRSMTSAIALTTPTLPIEGRKTKYIWEYVKPEKKKSLLISASQQP